MVTNVYNKETKVKFRNTQEYNSFMNRASGKTGMPTSNKHIKVAAKRVSRIQTINVNGNKVGRAK